PRWRAGIRAATSNACSHRPPSRAPRRWRLPRQYPRPARSSVVPAARRLPAQTARLAPRAGRRIRAAQFASLGCSARGYELSPEALVILGGIQIGERYCRPRDRRCELRTESPQPLAAALALTQQFAEETAIDQDGRRAHPGVVREDQWCAAPAVLGNE